VPWNDASASGTRRGAGSTAPVSIRAPSGDSSADAMARRELPGATTDVAGSEAHAAGSSGSSMAARISSGASAVLNTPSKGCTARMAGSPRTDRATIVAPSTVVTSGHSAAGSARQHLAESVPRVGIGQCAMCGTTSRRNAPSGPGTPVSASESWRTSAPIRRHPSRWDMRARSASPDRSMRCRG
jgi:hypothetical protein